MLHRYCCSLVYFPMWIRIWAAFFNADPCGSGSETLALTDLHKLGKPCPLVCALAKQSML